MSYNNQEHGSYDHSSYSQGYSSQIHGDEYGAQGQSMTQRLPQDLIPYKFYSSGILYSKDSNGNDFMTDRMQKIRNLRDIISVATFLNRNFNLYFRNASGEWQLIPSDSATIESVYQLSDKNDILTFHVGNNVHVFKEGFDQADFYVSITDDIASLCNKYTQKTNYALNPDRLRIKSRPNEVLAPSSTMFSLGEPLEFVVLPASFTVNVRYNGHDTPLSVRDDTTLRELYDMCRDRFSLIEFYVEILNGARLEYSKDTLDMFRIDQRTILSITIPVLDKRRVKYLCESCGRYFYLSVESDIGCECDSRIIYKVRTTDPIEYFAR